MKHKPNSPTSDPIVHWQPRHDRVVMLHIYGLTPDAIADDTGYTAPAVRRILKDPRAQRALEVLRQRMLGNAMQTIQDRMTGLGIKAVKNISDTIDQDFDHGTKAKIHQDDVSFELLARIGFGRKDQTAQGGGGGIQLPKEEAQQLVAAVAKANRAREIHAMPEEENVVTVESAELERSNGDGLVDTNGRDGDKSEKS